MRKAPTPTASTSATLTTVRTEETLPLSETAPQLISVVTASVASATTCRWPKGNSYPSACSAKYEPERRPPVRMFRKMAKPTASAACEPVRAMKN